MHKKSQTSYALGHENALEFTKLALCIGELVEERCNSIANSLIKGHFVAIP